MDVFWITVIFIWLRDSCWKTWKKFFSMRCIKMLKKEGKITDAIVENMLSWRHSGFNVYIGDRIFSDDKADLGNLARYIIRACFSQERMV